MMVLFIRTAFMANTECSNTSNFKESQRAYTFLSYGMNISNCQFHRITSFKGDGGVLYSKILNGEFIVIEKCIFDNCSADGDGGALFIDNRDSCIELKKLCAGKCYTKKYGSGQFCFCSNRYPKKCELWDSSFVICGVPEREVFSTVVFEYCLFYGASLNISKSHSSVGSIMHFLSIVRIVIGLSTFVNTVSCGSSCFQDSSGSDNHMIQECNIVNNTSNSSVLFINSCSCILLRSCIFSLNNGCLFGLVNSFVTANDTFVDHKTKIVSLSQDSSFNDVNISYKRAPTLVLDHFMTSFCYWKIDSHMNSSTEAVSRISFLSQDSFAILAFGIAIIVLVLFIKKSVNYRSLEFDLQLSKNVLVEFG